MIKTIIFDFGDVFINLKKDEAMQNALSVFGINTFSKDMQGINEDFEQGFINTESFLDFYLTKFPYLNKKDIINAWNFILADFPEYRITFLKQLANENNYKLILLSNTNQLHIDWIKKHIHLYNDFKNCFSAFYLSHEIGLRKPNRNIFEFVLNKHLLNPNETLFIDDTLENTLTASQLGIQVWNNNPITEDVINLFTIKKELF